MDPAVTEALGQHPLARHIDDFLTDLANANKSGHTIRAYRSDLIAFAAHYDGEIGEMTAAPIRAFLAGIAASSPTTAGAPTAPQRVSASASTNSATPTRPN